VISCLYGSTHDHFLPEWVDAVTKLDPAPHEVILAHSQPQFVPQIYAVQHRMNGGWRYPQAYYLTKALGHVTTDWVWIHDIDDLAFPDALEGLDRGRGGRVPDGLSPLGRRGLPAAPVHR
jgi:hypothetical protein